MTPEQKAREIIDKKLAQSGWIVPGYDQARRYRITASRSHAAEHSETSI